MGLSRRHLHQLRAGAKGESAFMGTRLNLK
jgi:hypothetical protein